MSFYTKCYSNLGAEVSHITISVIKTENYVVLRFFTIIGVLIFQEYSKR